MKLVIQHLNRYGKHKAPITLLADSLEIASRVVRKYQLEAKDTSHFTATFFRSEKKVCEFSPNGRFAFFPDGKEVDFLEE